MILDKYVSFLDKLFSKIEEKGVDISNLKLDHLAFRTESQEIFDELKPEAAKLGKLVHDNYVSGNQVNIYELTTPLQYKSYTIPTLELIGPHDEKQYATGFEHAEFVITEEFEEFANRYPNLDWNKSVIDRPDFPMLKLPLGDSIQVKFIKVPALEMAKMLNEK